MVEDGTDIAARKAGVKVTNEPTWWRVFRREARHTAPRLGRDA